MNKIDPAEDAAKKERERRLEELDKKRIAEGRAYRIRIGLLNLKVRYFCKLLKDNNIPYTIENSKQSESIYVNVKGINVRFSNHRPRWAKRPMIDFNNRTVRNIQNLVNDLILDNLKEYNYYK